ncbi:hypothetical protein J6590_029000 [Homalodisca vitripennis]|nr:hypothetical protein J6590_029000 [Homalodisca vitripennis]
MAGLLHESIVASVEIRRLHEGQDAVDGPVEDNGFGPETISYVTFVNFKTQISPCENKPPMLGSLYVSESVNKKRPTLLGNESIEREFPVQRKVTLKFGSSCRKGSEPVVQVIASVITIDLKMQEHEYVFTARKSLELREQSG